MSMFEIFVGGTGIKTKCGAILTVVAAIFDAVPVLQPYTTVIRTIGEVVCTWGIGGGVVAQQLKK